MEYPGAGMKYRGVGMKYRGAAMEYPGAGMKYGSAGMEYPRERFKPRDSDDFGRGAEKDVATGTVPAEEYR